jgi:hypothetical protein
MLQRLRARGDAAITEAGVAAPDVTLTAETFLAMTNSGEVHHSVHQRRDRELVAAIYDELRRPTRRQDAAEDDRTISICTSAKSEPNLAQRSEIALSASRPASRPKGRHHQP